MTQAEKRSLRLIRCASDLSDTPSKHILASSPKRRQSHHTTAEIAAPLPVTPEVARESGKGVTWWVARTELGRTDPTDTWPRTPPSPVELCWTENQRVTMLYGLLVAGRNVALRDYRDARGLVALQFNERRKWLRLHNRGGGGSRVDTGVRLSFMVPTRVSSICHS